MPDSKITALTAITSVNPATFPLVIVDTSDTSMAGSGTTKKVTTNQLLGSGGTATLASATITGDLTVDTSTLYVSSSADKVAIGTTSLSNEKLTVAGNISANAWLGRSNVSAPAGDCSIFRSADNTLGFGIASSTAMTLNSTGLGVGGSPTSQLTVGAGATANPASTVAFTKSTANEYRLKLTSGSFNANGNWIGLGLGYSSDYMKIGIIAEAKDGNGRGYLHFALNDASTSANASIADARITLKSTGQARFVPLAADPSGAEAGDVYYNSTSNKLKCYNGTTWNDLF